MVQNIGQLIQGYLSVIWLDALDDGASGQRSALIDAEESRCYYEETSFRCSEP